MVVTPVVWCPKVSQYVPKPVAEAQHTHSTAPKHTSSAESESDDPSHDGLDDFLKLFKDVEIGPAVAPTRLDESSLGWYLAMISDLESEVSVENLQSQPGSPVESVAESLALDASTPVSTPGSLTRSSDVPDNTSLDWDLTLCPESDPKSEMESESPINVLIESAIPEDCSFDAKLAVSAPLPSLESPDPSLRESTLPTILPLPEFTDGPRSHIRCSAEFSVESTALRKPALSSATAAPDDRCTFAITSSVSVQDVRTALSLAFDDFVAILGIPRAPGKDDLTALEPQFSGESPESSCRSDDKACVTSAVLEDPAIDTESGASSITSRERTSDVEVDVLACDISEVALELDPVNQSPAQQPDHNHKHAPLVPGSMSSSFPSPSLLASVSPRSVISSSFLSALRRSPGHVLGIQTTGPGISSDFSPRLAFSSRSIPMIWQPHPTPLAPQPVPHLRRSDTQKPVLSTSSVYNAPQDLLLPRLLTSSRIPFAPPLLRFIPRLVLRPRLPFALRF